MNRVTHGMRAILPVIQGEDPEEWKSHRTGIIDALAPANALEDVLAERIALLFWRMHRVTHFETAAVVAGQRTIDDEPASVDDSDYPLTAVKITGTLEEARGRNDADLQDAMQRLRQLNVFMGSEPDQAILQADAVELINVGANEVDIDPKDVAFPALPAHVAWESFDGWTAALVTCFLDAIAKRAGTDVGTLVHDMCATQEERTKGARTNLERLERRRARLQMERLLPDTATLEKITRYEAHLHRQLVQTFHEFEALQMRRKGAVAPLARIDVTVMEPQG